MKKMVEEIFQSTPSLRRETEEDKQQIRADALFQSTPSLRRETEAFETAKAMFDETMYLVRIYEVVKRTRGKEYKRIANVRGYSELETTVNNDTITRHSVANTIWFD